jgi:hypothetical protein
MELVPTEGDREYLVVALGSEEAVILLQAGGMLRRVLDASPAWNSAARFLTSPKSAEGMLAVLPRRVGASILAEAAGHTVERDFKKLLFHFLSEAERPPFAPSQ